MSHQALNLMTNPMNQAGGIKTVNTGRLVALNPDRKGRQAGSTTTVLHDLAQPLTSIDE